VERTEAVAWLEAQGVHVRVFGDDDRAVYACNYGPLVPTGESDIQISAAIASFARESDGTWVLRDHGIEVGRHDSLDATVSAAHECLVERARIALANQCG
jgi:hypothetical protein